MLIYEKDGHFLTHRDTEKEPHMFGTLLLQLPTSDGFQGGALTVSHHGVTKSIDLSLNSDNEFQTVSFYADCEHELHPITDGQRVCLVYNLVATPPEHETGKSFPTADINIETENKLRLICDDWKTNDLEKITKIGYQLEHKYTHQSLGVSTLKGRDEIILATFLNAKDAQGSNLFRVSILLMRLCFVQDDRGENYCDEVEPYVVVEEGDDGVWNRKMLNNGNCFDWNMKCYSKNGWWVMPNESLHRLVNAACTDANADKNVDLMDASDEEKESSKDDSHDENDEDEDYTLEDEEGYEIKYNRQMFFNTCDITTKDNAYNGNDGGSRETYYYAAAIVLSLRNDAASLQNPTVKEPTLL
jgi:hypothetical protein